MKLALFLTLAVFAGFFVFTWIRAARRSGAAAAGRPGLLIYPLGFVINFLDTLGIGSFATMSASFKIFGLVRDENIPGTLNVSATIPGILEAFIYVAIVDVDVVTLITMIAGSVVGAWWGASFVSRWPRLWIQLGMGFALTVTALFSFASQMHWLPDGAANGALGVTGLPLVAGFLATALLGALMTLGIGFFAPCMMVIALLGMSPKTAFPIMMGSVAFLGPVASEPFLRRGSYDHKMSLGLTLGGIPGVLAAAYLVRSLPLHYLRWLITVVILYTALMLLRSAAASTRRQTNP